jgi:large subunit ribosomal protein L21
MMRLYVPAWRYPRPYANGQVTAGRNQRVYQEGGTKMYAIIATGGKQYKVSEGDVIDVEKLNAEVGNEVTFDQVLAVSSDDALKVASDVANATVTATVMDQGRAKKVVVYHFKPKTGNHKKNGHRQAYTRVKIEKINN